MIKTTCDGCSRECNDSIGQHRVSFPYHLVEDPAIRGYQDREGNVVSGRLDSFDLCNRCFNVVMGAAVDKLKELKELPR
jgi:predicted PP-loop superfamily ATPase